MEKDNASLLMLVGYTLFGLWGFVDGITRHDTNQMALAGGFTFFMVLGVIEQLLPDRKGAL